MNEKRKKIGIFTFHRSLNYGAVLQAFALKEDIKKEGFEANIVDYRCEAIEKQYRLFYLDKSSVFSFFKTFISNIVFFRKNLKRRKSFQRFIIKYLDMTTSYDKKQILDGEVQDLLFAITGSDQVWNERFTNGLDDVYMLNFGEEDMRRISYAASTGRDRIDDETKFKENLARFSAISVREKNLADILKQLTMRDIQVVCDPVFLLRAEEWSAMISKENHGKYIFCYDLEEKPEMYAFANYVAKKSGLKIIYFSRHNRGYDRAISENHYTDSPFEFLSLLKNAQYIITDSFHGTSFSLIFEKKFWTFSKSGSNARIENLLDVAGLRSRFIVKGKMNDYKNCFDDSIDYASARKRLDRYKNDSKVWLKRALQKDK